VRIAPLFQYFFTLFFQENNRKLSFDLTREFERD